MAARDRTMPSHRFVLSAAVVALLAVAPAASAAEAPATGSARADPGYALGSAAGSRPERPCTQPICLFVQDKGRLKTIPYPFANVYLSHGINELGEITGTYNEDLAETTPLRGYLRDRRGVRILEAR